MVHFLIQQILRQEVTPAEGVSGRSRLELNSDGPEIEPPSGDNNPNVTVTLSANPTILEDVTTIIYTVTLNNPALTPMNVVLSNGLVITIPAFAFSATSTQTITPDEDVYKDTQNIDVSITGSETGGYTTVTIGDGVRTVVNDTIDVTDITLSANPNPVTDGDDIVYKAQVTHAPQKDDLVITLSNDEKITIKVGELEGTVTVKAVVGQNEEVSITSTNNGGNFEGLSTADTEIVDIQGYQK